MKKMIKEKIKSMLKHLNHFRIWFHTVILEHHNTKLSLYHKLRAIRYGFSSDFYYMFNLKENNPRDYISDYKRMISREINSKYLMVFDNKLIFEKIFSQYVNVPKTIIVIDDELYFNDGNKIEDINEVLTENKYIIKPISDTGGGTGVSLIEKEGNDTFLFQNKKVTSKELYDELKKDYKGYMITEYVNQHQYSERINPSSVNTIRIITLRDPSTNEYIIPCAVHRFGNKKSHVVDNASSGGYITKIDIEKGILLETKTFLDTKSLEIHPDSKVKIYGTIIPHFDEIKKKLLNTANKFPYIPFIAWDVVVTEEGFCVIEINASSGLGIFQIFGSIKDTKLGEFYKKYGLYK